MLELLKPGFPYSPLQKVISASCFLYKRLLIAEPGMNPNVPDATRARLYKGFGISFLMFNIYSRIVRDEQELSKHLNVV